MINTRIKRIIEELNAYDDAIVRATDAKGSLEFAEEKGEARGKEKEKIATAKTLLNLNEFSVEKISQITGLTIDEIERIKKTI